MVFSELHWIPSVIAAILTVLLAVIKDRRYHKYIAFGMVFFGLIGLFGYISEGNYRFGFDLHTLHILSGFVALVLAFWVFASRMLSKKPIAHCTLGNVAAVFALIALVIGVILILGTGGQAVNTIQVPNSNLNVSTTMPNQNNSVPKPNLNVTVIGNKTLASSILPEVEATEFQGVKLTPISQQNNNAIKGTQYINRSTYRLEVTGLVKKNLSMSYDELLALPSYSEVVELNCVEGWSFTAKWTGFRLADLFNLSGLAPDASYVMFYSSDGYSTGLPLSYLQNNNILMAYGLNDVTLPADRGFPFQLVAENKYGYKWAKWITKIEVINNETLGYWESNGYSNVADVGGPAFG